MLLIYMSFYVIFLCRVQAKARVIHPSSKIDEEDKRPPSANKRSAFSLNMDAYNHRYLINHTETRPIEDQAV